MTNQFTEATALTLTQQQNEQFPVNLEDACSWVGRRKEHAVTTVKKYFIEGQEFTRESRKIDGAGRPAVSYYLTVDCFKQFAMLANTPQGKAVRLHFIAAEKQLKEILNTPKLTQHTQVEKVQAARTMLDICKELGFSSNPRYQQAIQDQVGDLIGVSQPLLPGNAETWLGVAERAEELGYAPSLVVKSRAMLGKFVAKCDLDSKKEKRLCNGTMRPINVYLLTDDLDDAIHEYFS